MEFKGTKGEWYSIGNYIGVKNEKTRITHVTGSYPISDEEDSENARLMAHSKEMLELLQKFISENMLSVYGQELAENVIERALKA